MRLTHSHLLKIFFASMFFAKIAIADPQIKKGKDATEGLELEEAEDEQKEEDKEVRVAKPTAFLDLRPSFTPEKGEFHTENTVELGYQTAGGFKISYLQYFNTNLYNPDTKKNVFKKTDFSWQDGFFKAKFGNLWESEDKKSNFSFQARAYTSAPSNSYANCSRYNQGMITILRPYFQFAHEFSDFISADVAVVPSAFLFRKQGYEAHHKFYANPSFEELTVFNVDLKFSETVTLSIPLITQATRYRNFMESATHNNQWAYTVWTFTELDWEFTKNQSVGAAYYSDNFVKSDLKGTQVKQGFEEGVFQLLWNVKY